MMIDFIIYGLGFVFIVLGMFIAGINEAFSNIGLILFWAGVVFGFAKKDDIGLTVGFGVYSLFYLVIFILALAGVFYRTTFFFAGALCQCIIGAVLLIPTVINSGYYKKYKQNQQIFLQAAAVQASMAPKEAPSAGSVCATCGAPIAANAKFCTKCGSKQPEKRVCPQCGAEVPAGSAFCMGCGASMGN
jgi:ribosomal protein L40E